MHESGVIYYPPRQKYAIGDTQLVAFTNVSKIVVSQPFKRVISSRAVWRTGIVLNIATQTGLFSIDTPRSPKPSRHEETRRRGRLSSAVAKWDEWQKLRMDVAIEVGEDGGRSSAVMA